MAERCRSVLKRPKSVRDGYGSKTRRRGELRSHLGHYTIDCQCKPVERRGWRIVRHQDQRPLVLCANARQDVDEVRPIRLQNGSQDILGADWVAAALLQLWQHQ